MSQHRLDVIAKKHNIPPVFPFYAWHLHEAVGGGGDLLKSIKNYKTQILREAKAQIIKEVAKEMTDKLFKKGTPENVRLMERRVIEKNPLTYIHIEYWNKDCKAFIGHTFNKPNDAIKFLIKETRRLNNE